jgi:hypothetical protein
LMTSLTASHNSTHLHRKVLPSLQNINKSESKQLNVFGS